MKLEGVFVFCYSIVSYYNPPACSFWLEKAKRRGAVRISRMIILGPTAMATAASLLLLSMQVSSEMPRISLSESSGARVLVDSFGRERFFHGTNVVVKGPPWAPDRSSFSLDVSLSREDFEIMREMGLNGLRLGVMWPGAEPVEGQYNETYLEEMVAIASEAAEFGIYTLVDNHQDSFSEYFCGEGFPDWIRVKTTPEHSFLKAWPAPVDDPLSDFYQEPLASPPNATLPTRGECDHSHAAQYQAAKESAAAYDAVYMDEEIRASWAGFWQKVASSFAGMSHILGFELTNEPFMGDFYRDPLIAVPYPNPHNADAKRLQPAYDALTEAIRDVDDETLIFFPGVTWDDAGPGFSHAPASDPGRSVLAYHYYEGPQFRPSMQTSVQKKGAERLNTGFFLTEFSNSRKGRTSIYDAADAEMTSWLQWEWKTFCRESNETLEDGYESQYGVWGSCKGFIKSDPTVPPKPPQEQHAQYYRIYPEAVSGKTKHFSYDADARTFTMQWELDLSISDLAPTVVRIPSGWLYTVNIDDRLLWKAVTGGLEIIVGNDKNIDDHTLITLDITVW